MRLLFVRILMSLICTTTAKLSLSVVKGPALESAPFLMDSGGVNRGEEAADAG